MKVALAVIHFLTLSISLVHSCPIECYCNGKTMSCSKVNFTDNDLATLEIPDEITELRMSDNGLTSITADVLYNFRRLESLEISRNPIKAIPAGTFEGFRKLKKLILNENNIEEITERSFLGLSNLKTLELQRNKITHLQAGVFTELKSILQIRLQKNQLKTVGDDVFSPLSTLRDLFLTGNQIISIGDSAFKHMQMSRLGLSTNMITTIPHSAFEGFQITGRILLLDNPLDCSCKYSMSYVVNLKHLEKKIWGYCKTPYEVKDVQLFKAHGELMCSMCDLNPCKNNGKCEGNKTQFKCVCAERYKGQYCEVNICSAIPNTIPQVLDPDNVPLKQQRQINHTEYVIVKEQVSNKDDAKKLKILYAMCSFEFVVIICFVVYFMWKRYEEWKLQKQYEHEKSRAILFSIRNQTNAKLAKALCEENEEFPFDLKSMILKGSVPV